MLKMMELLFCLFFLCFLGLTCAGQESIEYLHIYETRPEVIHSLSHSDLSIAVPVNNNVLREVSTSVSKAESWLRLHVLAHFPATKITTILVGDSLLCQKGHENGLGLLLPSLKNIHHSLIRWGLEKDVKVSPVFSSHCLHQNSAPFSDDLVKKVIKPVLEFLKNANSTYSISPTFLLSSHMDIMRKIESFDSGKVNVVVSSEQVKKLISRKLSETFMDSPPPFSFPISPELPPPFVPASSPDGGFDLPPCSMFDDTAPAPAPAREIGVMQKLWCVSKPSVPAETLQEAMDYACGEGGGDCEEIMPHGSCFDPDTVVAHASYAFNSYWQKTKRNGGTCDFGGTAMIINSDPSFLQCQFVHI